MGTLGLAYPETAAAMREAVAVARAAGTRVLIDVNWRPVFFEAPDGALDVILPFVREADIVKITDEEAEWAFGIAASDALANPGKARHTSLALCIAAEAAGHAGRMSHSDAVSSEESV